MGPIKKTVMSKNLTMNACCAAEMTQTGASTDCRCQQLPNALTVALIFLITFQNLFHFLYDPGHFSENDFNQCY